MDSVTVRDSAGASAEIATTDHLLLMDGAYGWYPSPSPANRIRPLAESPVAPPARPVERSR
jgi:hypothetical protein